MVYFHNYPLFQLRASFDALSCFYYLIENFDLTFWKLLFIFRPVLFIDFA